MPTAISALLTAALVPWRSPVDDSAAPVNQSGPSAGAHVAFGAAF